MAPAELERVQLLFEEELGNARTRWGCQEQVVLYDELRRVLTRTACVWAGVSLPAVDLEKRTHQLSAMFDGAGAIGPRHWWARLARRLAEGWIQTQISRCRRHPDTPPSLLQQLSHWKDDRGQELPVEVAAVEMLNLLRPIVAIAVYLTQLAQALHLHPEWHERLRQDAQWAFPFVSEVRRYYPFFPAVVARVREDFEWRGYAFKAGTQTVLDLYGTNHDVRTWREPETFEPDRFLDYTGDPYNFIPQGGGDHATHHRCAGEWLTEALMRRFALFLANELRYEVPAQDLLLDWRRLPALPRSRMIIQRVRPPC